MIKAITFDLDGVYFVHGKSNFIKSLEELGVSRDKAKEVFLNSDRMHKEYKTGRISDDEFWAWAIKQWDIDMTVPEIIDILIKGYEVNEQVVEAVRRVRRNGYKTLICSNNFPARINGLQERFHFLDDFDVATLSYEVGCVKPSKEIFKKLVVKTGVKPEEIIFADDEVNNLTGAKEVGIQTFVYEDFQQFTSELEKRGVKL